MKKKIAIPILMTGILAASAALTGFAGTVHRDLPQRYIEDIKIHWAQEHVEKLNQIYGIEDLLRGQDLNQVIPVEALGKLIQATVDSSFSKGIKTNTREAVVSTMMEIWAEKMGENLEEMPIPMILIYSDTEEIDRNYVHPVMLAYFHDIAKGREVNLFAPKASVTYGEAVTLISKLQGAIDEGGKVTEEEGKKEERMGKIFETTANYRIEENAVVFDFQLTNLTDKPQDISFSSGQQYEIIITNSNGEGVYTYSADKMFTMALIFKTLEAGESIGWQEKWEPRDKDGNLITEGSFEAMISVLLMERDMGEEETTAKVHFDL